LRVFERDLLAATAAPPHIPHPTLPSAARHGISIMAGARFTIAFDALLHLFVDLAQRHAARSFQFVGISISVGIRIGEVCHGNDLSGMDRPDLEPSGRSRQAGTAEALPVFRAV
jgi:hypothetical protein